MLRDSSARRIRFSRQSCTISRPQPHVMETHTACPLTLTLPWITRFLAWRVLLANIARKMATSILLSMGANDMFMYGVGLSSS